MLHSKFPQIAPRRNKTSHSHPRHPPLSFSGPRLNAALQADTTYNLIPVVVYNWSTWTQPQRAICALSKQTSAHFRRRVHSVLKMPLLRQPLDCPRPTFGTSRRIKNICIQKPDPVVHTPFVSSTLLIVGLRDWAACSAACSLMQVWSHLHPQLDELLRTTVSRGHAIGHPAARKGRTPPDLAIPSRTVAWS
jgi:hypothetical protein